MVQLTNILDMSVKDRISIVEAIWNSIKKEDITITQVQKEELDHRVQLHDSGAMAYCSWDEVKRELRSKGP